MIGDLAIQAKYVGDSPVLREYLGDELVYESVPLTLEMVVEGTSFQPQLQLISESEATVLWRDETDSVVGTGLTPTITWGDSGPHTIGIYASAPEDIVTLNLGFHEEQDNGLYSLSSSNRHPTQPVTSITGLQELSGLRRFMAARTDGTNSSGSSYNGPLLGGHLDFSGMANLEYIECYMAEVESVNLSGCTNLIRLCLEQCDLEYLDLNPVRGTLRDLRAAFQIGGSLELAALTGPMPNLYHFCTRRQILTGMPDVQDLPAIQQLWVWRCALNEDSIIIRSSEDLHSILLASDGGGGTENVIRYLDLANQTFAGLSGPPRLEAFGVGLEEVDITGMGPVSTILFHNNQLDEESVDHILSVVNGWNTSNGTLRLANGNAAPSASGLADVDELRGRGWTVTHEAIRTLIWSDEFDRSDAEGWANSGGWFPGTGETDTDVEIVDEQLILTGENSYRRFAHLGNGELPANLEVEVGFTITTPGVPPGSYWGVLARWNGSSGKRVLFRATQTVLRIGNAINSSDAVDIDVSSALPSGWDSVGQHSLSLRCVGTATTVFWDGVPIASRAFNLNGEPDLAVGFVGEPQNRAWDYIRVYTA